MVRAFQSYCDEGQLEYLTVHQHFLSSRNTVYLIVVDASLPALEQVACLRHWVEILSVRLPPQECQARQFSIIVVGTKIDLVPEAGVIATLEATYRAVLEQFQLVVAGVLFVSGRSDNEQRPCRLKELLHIIALEAKAILQHSDLAYVPHFYRHVSNTLQQWGRGAAKGVVGNRAAALFVPLSSIESVVGATGIALTSCLEFLHSIGLVVFVGKAAAVCIRPELLVKVMSVFVAPDDHLSRALDRKLGPMQARGSVISYSTAIRRLNGVLSILGEAEVDEAYFYTTCIPVLERLDLCYRLPSNGVDVYREGSANCAESMLLLPALRPPGDLLVIPDNDDTGKQSQWCGREWYSCGVHPVPQHAFFRLQVRLKHMHHPEYKIYRNAVMLRLTNVDESESIGLLVYRLRQKQSLEACLEAEGARKTVSGDSPQRWSEVAGSSMKDVRGELSKRLDCVIDVVARGQRAFEIVENVQDCLSRLQQTEYPGVPMAEVPLCDQCIQTPGRYTRVCGIFIHMIVVR